MQKPFTSCIYILFCFCFDIKYNLIDLRPFSLSIILYSRFLHETRVEFAYSLLIAGATVSRFVFIGSFFASD